MTKIELRQIIREELELAFKSKNQINESPVDLFQTVYDALGGSQMVNVGGESIEKGAATLAMLGTALGITVGAAYTLIKDKVEKAKQAIAKLDPKASDKLKKDLSQK